MCTMTGNLSLGVGAPGKKRCRIEKKKTFELALGSAGGESMQQVRVAPRRVAPRREDARR